MIMQKSANCRTRIIVSSQPPVKEEEIRSICIMASTPAHLLSIEGTALSIEGVVVADLDLEGTFRNLPTKHPARHLHDTTSTDTSPWVQRVKIRVKGMRITNISAKRDILSSKTLCFEKKLGCALISIQ